MNELALFAGAGGGLLASKWLLGHRLVGYVENDAYCQVVIKARQADGLLDVAPIFGDVRGWSTVDWLATLSYHHDKGEDGMGAHRKAYLDEAVRLYEAGFSLAEVAAHYGTTRQNMWKALKRRGAKFRPQLRYGKNNHFYRGGGVAIDRVQNLAERAVEKGILERPNHCEQCGASGIFQDGRSMIQAHHDDYNKPLEVRWLCQPCHHQWHKENRAVPMKEDEEVSDKVDVVSAGFP